MINEVEIMREAVLKIFPSHAESGTLHMYTHAVGEGHRPVTYEALTKTFDEIDELRMDHEEARETCLIFVCCGGHCELDETTKMVMNTNKNTNRLFDVEGKLRKFVDTNPYCFVIAYINGCRKKPHGPSPSIAFFENERETLGTSDGNIMIKFTTRPGSEATANESER